MNKKRRAFNLIEVTIVFTVLITLSLIAFEANGKYIFRARKVAQGTEACRLQSAKALYWFDNNGKEARDAEVLQERYIINKGGQK